MPIPRRSRSAATQLEPALERRPRRVEVALGELEVGAANEHGSEAALLVGDLLGLVGELARPRELPPDAGDARLVHEHVADGRVPRQLLERLEGLLEEHPRADRPAEAGPADLGDVDRRGNPVRAVDHAKEVEAPRQALLGAVRLPEEQVRGADGVGAERLGAGRPVLAGERERPPGPGQGRGAVVPGDRDVREPLQAAPLEPVVADGHGYLEALLHPGVEGVGQARTQVDGRGGEEGLGPERGGLRRALERRGEPPLGLHQVDPSHPERHERRTQPEGAVGVASEERVECRPHVCGLAVEGLRVDRRLGELERPVGMSRGERVRLAGVVELSPRIEANRLEQPVAAVGAAVVEAHEGLLDEAPEHVRDVGRLEEVARADHLGRAELEAAGEHAEPAEEDALVGLEQVMAPAERRLERLLPGRSLARPGPKKTEAVVEPGRNRGGGQRPDPTRGELERKREPVEPEADARHVVGVLVGQLEPLGDGGGALDEEDDRLEAGEIRCAGMLSRVGDRERRDSEDDLAGDAKRLTARHEQGQLRRRAEELRRQGCARGEHVLAVVEDEEQLAAGEVPHDGILEALVGEREHVESGGDGDRDRGRARRGELDERRPVGVRALHGPRELESEARLARATGPAEREQPAPVKERGELGELVSATDERARVGGKAVLPAGRVGFLQRGGELIGKRLERLPPSGSEVVVAVLRQELAGVEAERGPQRRGPPASEARQRRPPRRRRRRPLRPARAGRLARRSPRRRVRDARRGRPGSGCWPRRRGRARARAHPSPARGAACGRARARAASRARAPFAASRRRPEPPTRRPRQRTRRGARS